MSSSRSYALGYVILNALRQETFGWRAAERIITKILVWTIDHSGDSASNDYIKEDGYYEAKIVSKVIYTLPIIGVLVGIFIFQML